MDSDESQATNCGGKERERERFILVQDLTSGQDIYDELHEHTQLLSFIYF